jgi:hypothetical protein
VTIHDYPGIMLLSDARDGHQDSGEHYQQPDPTLELEAKSALIVPT